MEWFDVGMYGIDLTDLGFDGIIHLVCDGMSLFH
jgi:hypothetical protein